MQSNLSQSRDSIHPGWLIRQVQSILPKWVDIRASLVLFAEILAGAIILFPLFSRLPFLGWDWYFFFNANHPTDNIFNPASPFLPYTKYFIALLTWMNWRDSLAILGGMTYMAIALGTWKNGGKYASIVLALTTPIPFFDLWVGHPDGLALIGLLSGLIPLALTQPQITLWGFLRSKAWIFWLGVCIIFVFVLRPNYLSVFSAGGNGWGHPASFGWHALGLPVLIIGLALIAGAGQNLWLLMSAGCMISPDLMPYHLLILLPAIGKISPRKKAVVWVAAWLVAVGIGLGGPWRWINLLFPLSVYFSLQTWQGYKDSITGYIALIRDYWKFAVNILARK
jgi:hypothetical protein